MNTTDKTILELTTEETEKYIDNCIHAFPQGVNLKYFLIHF